MPTRGARCATCATCARRCPSVVQRDSVGVEGTLIFGRGDAYPLSEGSSTFLMPLRRISPRLTKTGRAAAGDDEMHAGHWPHLGTSRCWRYVERGGRRLMTRDEEKIRGVRKESDLDARSIRLAFSDVSRAVTPDTPTLAAVAHGTPKARWSQAQQVAHAQSSGAASRTARWGHQLDIVVTTAAAPLHNKQQSHLVAPPDKCNRGGRGNVKTSKKGTRIQRRKLAAR